MSQYGCKQRKITCTSKEGYGDEGLYQVTSTNGRRFDTRKDKRKGQDFDGRNKITRITWGRYKVQLHGFFESQANKVVLSNMVLDFLLKLWHTFTTWESSSHAPLSFSCLRLLRSNFMFKPVNFFWTTSIILVTMTQRKNISTYAKNYIMFMLTQKWPNNKVS